MIYTLIEGAKRSGSKVFGLVCAAVLALAVCVGVQAATSEEAHAAEPYKYTVVLYAGNGTIDGADAVEIGSFGYGEQATVDFAAYDITPPDDRYYVKGVRLVGRDDSVVEAPSFKVKENTQYVVAYGLKKDQTEYTVNYVDSEGNQLAESQTFIGNIGDKPVVAYRYIEGYQPNAYNITGTLSGNEAANVFNFVYTPLAGTDSEGDGAGDGGAMGTAGSDAPDQSGEDQVGGASDQEGAAATEDEPVEVLDIDDEENPLAGIDAKNDAGFSIADVLPWVLGVLVAAALISFIVLLIARKRARENA